MVIPVREVLRLVDLYYRIPHQQFGKKPDQEHKLPSISMRGGRCRGLLEMKLLYEFLLIFIDRPSS